MYVVKFRGAGQGVLALVAELVAGEIGRLLGLNVPELVFIEVDEKLGRNEPDQEIRELLQASIGLNLALDYLPGSVTFDPAAGDAVEAELASMVVWFDAFVTNVDRTPRNTNLLYWHRALYLIDHGAALYFHHDWRDLQSKAHNRFSAIKNHVLLPRASEIGEVGRRLRQRLSSDKFTEILRQVPDGWLLPEPGASTPDEKREGYVQFLTERLEAADLFVEEAANARSSLV